VFYITAIQLHYASQMMEFSDYLFEEFESVK